MSATAAVLAASTPVSDGVPTGSDTAAAQAYYEWLYQHYVDRAPAAATSGGSLGSGRPWEITWGGTFLQIVSVGIVLIFLFWVFAWFFNHPRHTRPMLYRPASYGGTITERHGRFGWFNAILSAGIVLWALYYAVSHVAFGQVY